MVRTPFLDKNGIRKGAWSREEDDILKAYVLRHGHCNWRALPKLAGLSRCGKSCRLRWLNYLRPGLKRGNYSKQEEDLIIQLHNQLGNKWSKIAEKLPGRADNEIKNYWHTNLKKKKKKKKKQKRSGSEELEEKYLSSKQGKEAERFIIQSPPPILESSSYSSSEVSSFGTFQDYSSELHDFWTQPFVLDHDQLHAFTLPNLIADDALLFSSHEDSVDLFYQIMHELPPN